MCNFSVFGYLVIDSGPQLHVEEAVAQHRQHTQDGCQEDS